MLTKIRNAAVMALAAVGLVLTAGISTAATHHASRADATGTMSFSEWGNLAEGQAQSNVEAACSCTGIVTNTWTNNGVEHKTVSYADDSGDAIGTAGAFLNYALQSGGAWRLNNWAGWGSDGSGLEFKYDDGVSNTQVGVVGLL